MSETRSDRTILVSFLQDNPDRSFRAGELKVKTGVSKSAVRQLLTGESKVTITEKPKNTFQYQAAGSSPGDGSRDPSPPAA